MLLHPPLAEIRPSVKVNEIVEPGASVWEPVTSVATNVFPSRLSAGSAAAPPVLVTGTGVDVSSAEAALRALSIAEEAAEAAAEASERGAPDEAAALEAAADEPDDGVAELSLPQADSPVNSATAVTAVAARQLAARQLPVRIEVLTFAHALIPPLCGCDVPHSG